MNIFNKVALAALGLAVLFSGSASAKDKVKLKDITGREVEVAVPVEHVILGEGRQMYFVAALDTEEPFKRVVGWRDDFKKADLDGYNAYLEKFPEMEHEDPNAIRLAPGKSGEIVWKFTNDGVFKIACLVPGHYDTGMHGDVTVAKK